MPYGEFEEHEISVTFCDERFKEWSADKMIVESIKEYWPWTKKLDTRRPIAGLIE